MGINSKEHYMKLLNRHAQSIKRTLDLMLENRTGDQDGNYPTELSNYDNHPAEMGSELAATELNNALIVHEKHALEEIDDAIKRLNDDKFGKCQICGEDIGEDRLDAMPYVRLCIDCEEEGEPERQFRKLDRPVEEMIWDAPFGRKYLNKREDDEYEGLDQFNDLMKYGSSDSPQDLGGYHEYEDYYTNEVDNQGIVDDMDQVTNDEYKRQLPD